MQRIESPRADDNAIEQEIKAKGLTAPRVTPADIEANILDTFYFNALEAAKWEINSKPDSQWEEPGTVEQPLSLLTFCVLVLKNGFTVTGESACTSPENFDAELGRKIARANAVNKVWPLMGYALKERLANANTQPSAADWNGAARHASQGAIVGAVKRATPATKAAKAHMGRIAGLRCVCCRLLDMQQETPTYVHHIREGRAARNDFLTLPLCWACHQGPRGVHGDKGWLAQLRMSEVDLLACVIEELHD